MLARKPEKIPSNIEVRPVPVAQITGVSSVWSTICSGGDQRKKIKTPRHWPLLGESTGDRWIQRAINAEHVSIWWRHHVKHGSWHGTPASQTEVV